MNAVQLVRRARPFAWGLAVLALIAMVIWWTGAQDGPSNRTNPGRPSPGDIIRPGVDLYPPDERRAAPTLEGATLDGAPLALTDLAGNIVVLNVWGSWCAPCRAETPDLVRLAKEKHRSGVRFVGINTRDTPAAAQGFVRAFKVPYPSVEDAEGRLLLKFRDIIPTSVVPTTVVVDRQGRIAARIIGPVTYPTLNTLLDDELAAGRRGR